MSRGLKIILLILGGIVAIGAIVYFIVFPLFNGQAPAPVNTNGNVNASLPASTNTNNQQPANVNSPPPPAAVSPETQQVSAAKSVARTFAERLDTYTNQNGLINLSDLQAISTPAVWKYIDGDYRAGLVKAMSGIKAYYSVTSTAMNVKIAAATDDQADASVQMQRVESGAVSKTSYIALDLKLKNIDGQWLVSWLEWEK
jgi:hypothetical protein